MIDQYFTYRQTAHKSSIARIYTTIRFDEEDFIDTANAAAQDLSEILQKDDYINLSPAESLILANELFCCH